MWLFSAPPRDQIRAKYGFEVTDPWLEHIMKSSVRFNSGGSGSFVSGDGLVITNHHVGLDALQKFSSKESNYVHDGFYAKSAGDEIKCVDLELNVLQSIEDVTARVNAAVPPTAAGEEAMLARRKVTAAIEKESRDKTGLRSDVVTLWQGGAYHLYRYKRYTDIRLVFAPEQQAAFFGGDPDNFEYPRYDLDICVFRVYENNAPIKPDHFLKWSEKGAQDGELVFVSGHPGNTSRLLTVPELEYLRDVRVPDVQQLLKRREVLLINWGARSEENARRSTDDLFSYKNSRKVYDGELADLQNPVFMSGKADAENAFKKLLADRPEGKEALAAFDRIGDSQKTLASIAVKGRMLESGWAFDSALFGIARELLRAGDERPKPNGERLKEFSDARRESFEQQLFSDKPIFNDLEILTLSDSLTFMVERLGYGDPIVQKVLAGKSPRNRASELVLGTKVHDLALRRKLYDGGAAAIAAAQDPMIELARSIDGDARGLRKIIETQGEIKQQAQATIGKARFAVLGASTYPDATFTLRLSYGRVEGYEENGQHVPAHTTIAGLYERSSEHHDKEPFDLPKRWIDRKDAIRMDTPYNFVSTADIIGGNSGSPTVNAAGEFVGIIFDGNIQSLSEDFGFGPDMRALSVHSAGILEALRSVYAVPALADELTTGHR